MSKALHYSGWAGMEAILIALCLIACLMFLAALPWLLMQLTFWWTRVRYARQPEECVSVKVVRLHDAMPYLHNRYGKQVEPILPYSLYYVTFKAEARAPLRFRVTKEDYYRISLGDTGQLTFRGKLFVSFQVQSSKIKPIFNDPE